MPTISIISQKGGAGKTTLTVHLATAATRAGYDALILDTDPQASASRWGTWRDGKAPDVVDCASPPLLAGKVDQAIKLGAELVIIDTPPFADNTARAACKLADLILIPCRPQAFDLAAIETTADLVQSSGKPAFVIFTGGPVRAPITYAEAREVIEGMGMKVAEPTLPSRAIFHHSTASGQTAQEVEPKGKGAEEMAALWKWTSEHVNMSARKQVNKKGQAK